MQMDLKIHLLAGTTASSIALLMEKELLVANVGDSKTFLCLDKLHNSVGTSVTSLDVIELTKDHHPDRDDEKAHIEAAGFCYYAGVPRVNGILAVSRAIGDVYLKRYGVIAKPDFVDWQLLNINEVFLVVASHGIFESMSTQENFTLLQDAHSEGEKQKHWRSSECENSSFCPYA